MRLQIATKAEMDATTSPTAKIIQPSADKFAFCSS